MPRIAGVDLPRNKRVEIGLTYIYGVGRPRSNEILEQTGIDPDKRVKDLTEDETRKGPRKTVPGRGRRRGIREKQTGS